MTIVVKNETLVEYNYPGAQYCGKDEAFVSSCGTTSLPEHVFKIKYDISRIKEINNDPNIIRVEYTNSNLIELMDLMTIVTPMGWLTEEKWLINLLPQLRTLIPRIEFE